MKMNLHGLQSNPGSNSTECPSNGVLGNLLFTVQTKCNRCVEVGSYRCNFAYSALACFRMGMSGSASFQRVRKSLYAAFALAVSPDMA